MLATFFIPPPFCCHQKERAPGRETRRKGNKEKQNKSSVGGMGSKVEGKAREENVPLRCGNPSKEKTVRGGFSGYLPLTFLPLLVVADLGFVISFLSFVVLLRIIPLSPCVFCSYQIHMIYLYPSSGVTIRSGLRLCCFLTVVMSPGSCYTQSSFGIGAV